MTDIEFDGWEREEAMKDKPDLRVLALIGEVRGLRRSIAECLAEIERLHNLYAKELAANLAQAVEMVRFRARRLGAHCN